MPDLWSLHLQRHLWVHCFYGLFSMVPKHLKLHFENLSHNEFILFLFIQIYFNHILSPIADDKFSFSFFSFPAFGLFGEACQVGPVLISPHAVTIISPDYCLFGALPSIWHFIVSSFSMGSIFRLDCECLAIKQICFCFCQMPRASYVHFSARFSSLKLRIL